MLRRIEAIVILCLGIGLLIGNPSSLLASGTKSSASEDSISYLLHRSGDDMQKYPQYAFNSARQALDIANRLGKADLKAAAARYMGQAKLNLEDYFEAKKYLSDALSYLGNENPTWKGDILFYLASSNYYLAEYEESNLYYRQAIEIFEKKGDKRKIAMCKQNVGLIYHELDDFKSATTYYKDALTLYQEIDNDTNTAAVFQNLGLICYANGEYDQAMKYLNESVAIYSDLDDAQNIAVSYSNMGLIQLSRMEFEKAYGSFRTSYEMFESAGYKLGKMWAMYNMGTANLQQQKFDASEDEFKKSLRMARELSSPEGVLSSLQALTELKELQGEYKDAFYYFNDYAKLKDSINVLESKERITELEAIYTLQDQGRKLSQSQKAIAASKKAIDKQEARNIVYYILLFVIVMISVIIYMAYRKKKSEEVKMHSSKLDLENVLLEKDKELEAQIMERKIAVESDKLKSAFLANMSHELRTPMNAIIAFSNFLREPDLPEPKKEEYLDHITSAGDSLLHLIDDIIDIAKLESNQLKISIGPVNISRMLRELKKVFLKLKTKNNYSANLVLTMDKHYDYIVNTDVLRVKQILNNLIDNAFKYTRRGVVEFGATHNEDGLLFFVRDTGIGIAPEKLGKIFDRFQQIDSELNRKYGGTGLGLAISKNLAELLGGKIWVESEQGMGSVFYVQIPANNFRKVEVLPDPNTSSRLVTENNYNWQTKTILIAEDEDLNYRVLDSCLSKTHARILRAEDGESAVRICSQEKVDLVLMDIQMPQMDGFEATQKIKSININLPVIAQTSFAMANEKERCIDVGCDEYITKPLDLEKLLAIIQKLFE
ncbi:MAG: tetratricopeptide repeat protein [Bacteroidales bacterium]|nr:tetratricopeptide repeat protein [Bacteroidales bacterium]